tara:strand:+ start:833 stop:1087 length:255 start_codon:yes stop_codon:yes gene_type:complete
MEENRETDRQINFVLPGAVRSAVISSDTTNHNIPKMLAPWWKLCSVVAPSYSLRLGHVFEMHELIDACIFRQNRSSQDNYYLVF